MSEAVFGRYRLAGSAPTAVSPRVRAIVYDRAVVRGAVGALALVVGLSLGVGHPAFAQAQVRDFDAERARKDLREMAAVGARSPGSDGKQRLVDLFVQRLRQAGLSADVQPLPRWAPGSEQAPLVNVVGEAAGTAKQPRLVVLIAHYDSSSSISPGPADVNCGLSGAAALLEAARTLGARPWPQSLLVALVDGHFQHEVTGRRVDADIGARAVAETLERSGRLAQIEIVIAVDRLGFAKLELANELGLSRDFQTELSNYLYAQHLSDAFRDDAPIRILDSHDPFRSRGVRAVLPVIGRTKGDNAGSDALCDHSLDLLRGDDLATFQAFGELIDRLARGRLLTIPARK